MVLQGAGQQTESRSSVQIDSDIYTVQHQCMFNTQKGVFKFNLNANLWHKKNKSDFNYYIF